jgi:hypothetical protein
VKGSGNITDTAGGWTLTPIDANTTLAYYHVHADIGTWLPQWLLNMANRSTLPDVINAMAATAATIRAGGRPEVQLGCDHGKPLVASPKLRTLGQRHRRKKVRIDIADAFPHQAVTFDEVECFGIACDDTRRQRGQEAENFAPPYDLAASHLTDDERMHQHILGFQRVSKERDRFVEMVNPHRGVDENQDGRRLLGAFALGSRPPSLARRRAPSRAIRARRPSWISAVRSRVPVIRCASSIN